MDDLVPAVHEALDPETAATFERRVERQADRARAALRAGRFDNADFAVGLELETYCVDADCRLRPVPSAAFEVDGCDVELGVHNAEFHTSPSVLGPRGFGRQAEELRGSYRAASAAAGEADARVVLDAMPAVPPAEGTERYLCAVDERDGVTVAANMQRKARYHALDEDTRRAAGGEIPFSVPGVDRTFPTLLFESLATSMQPHLQVPAASAFPRYFNAALRTLGPVLALATNSPFLPADLYDEAVDPDDLLARTPHELRIPVFERSVNVGDRRKVRVPEDLSDPTEVVDRLVADATVAPFLDDGTDGGEGVEEGPGYPELDHKRGTYWRWVRAVLGGSVPEPSGPENGPASVRIEYRPLPTQPTLRDTVSFQALVVGLLRGVAAEDHPLPTLDRDAAEASFYDVVERGLDADVAWVTADGDRVEDSERVYPDLFALARAGLAASDLAPGTVERLLAPAEARWEARTAPSDWKRRRVRQALDEGATLREAIASMGRQYVRRSAETAEEGTFADWL